MGTRIVFLGTGGSYPTKERNLSSVAVRMEKELVLFDCGEGTQRQIMHTNLSFMQVGCILISHFHADHFLGLPGLVQTMKLNDREKPLDIYGPPGTVRLMTGLLGLGHFTRTFDINAFDLDKGHKVQRDGYSITCAWGKHGVPNMAFAITEDDRPGRFDKPKALSLGIPEGPLFGRLQRGGTVEHDGRTFTPDMVLGPTRRGRKVVYSGDTTPCEAIEELAMDADVLIHDSTGAVDIEDKMNEWGHSSTRQAAEIAKRARVGTLFLSHISPRYNREECPRLEMEAKEIFENTIMAHDFFEYQVPLPD